MDGPGVAISHGIYLITPDPQKLERTCKNNTSSSHSKSHPEEKPQGITKKV